MTHNYRIPTEEEIRGAKLFNDRHKSIPHVSTEDIKKIADKLMPEAPNDFVSIRDEIDKLTSLNERSMRISRFVLNKLESKCVELGHVIVPSWAGITRWNEEEDPRGDYGGAHCLICRKHFGWYCPISSKKYCEYDREHREYCIHCGYPGERK